MRKLAIILVSFLVWKCARQTQPSGGPKDTDPPELVSSTPDNGQKNFKGTNIELSFDEFVKLKDAKEEILISPSPGAKTKFSAIKNRVTIVPENPWKDSTTYSIAFRNGIQDINESNPTDDLHLAFSTGPTIDSLKLSGLVTEAFKEKPAEKMTVALYQSDTFDIFQHKPTYFTKTNKTGRFQIQNMKAGKYYVYAFNDKSKNAKVDSKTESFGFLAKEINLPGEDDSIHIELIHLDTRPLKLSSVRNTNTISTIRFNKALDSISLKTNGVPIIYTFGDSHSEAVVYKDFDQKDSLQITVHATDSMNQQLDTAVYVKFTDNKKIEEKFKVDWQVSFSAETSILTAEASLNKRLLSINYDSMYIQIDTSTFQSISAKNITVDTLLKKIKIQSLLKIDLKTKTVNPVFLMGKGALISIDKDSTKTMDLKIKIPKQEDTGSVSLEINTKEPHFEVRLLTADNKLVRSFRDQKNYTFTYLNPAEYRITIIIDANNNSRWDPGNFYKRKEPEKILLYKNSENKYTFPIRANWEVGPLVITF